MKYRSVYGLDDETVEKVACFSKACALRSKMKNEYPESLPLKEQGKFMVGYYQQMQDLYEKKNKENEKGKGEN